MLTVLLQERVQFGGHRRPAKLGLVEDLDVSITDVHLQLFLLFWEENWENHPHRDTSAAATRFLQMGKQGKQPR